MYRASRASSRIVLRRRQLQQQQARVATRPLLVSLLSSSSPPSSSSRERGYSSSRYTPTITIDNGAFVTSRSDGDDDDDDNDDDRSGHSKGRCRHDDSASRRRTSPARQQVHTEGVLRSDILTSASTGGVTTSYAAPAPGLAQHRHYHHHQLCRNAPTTCVDSSYPGQIRQIQLRQYHATPVPEKGVAIILGLGALSAASYAASTGVKAYREWKESWPEEDELERQRQEEEEERLKQEGKEGEGAFQSKDSSEQQQQKTKKADGKQQQQQQGKRENIFAKWFGVGVGSKYYEGGFEEKMTKREAALILGVRESSSSARIKEAHRKLLILNHPDTGGSNYMAGKINEAKELLLKGRRD